MSFIFSKVKEIRINYWDLSAWFQLKTGSQKAETKCKFVCFCFLLSAFCFLLALCSLCFFVAFALLLLLLAHAQPNYVCRCSCCYFR